MNAVDVNANFISPALQLLPARMDTPEARVELLAISAQESDGFRARRQYQGGPARGLLQFETGGTRGVLRHPASADLAITVCAKRNVSPITPVVITARFEFDDVLAFAFGRLLLYTDPAALPKIGDVDGAWQYYLRNWRPGAPLPKKWAANYNLAMRAINGE